MALHIHLHILQLQLASKHAANLPCLSRAVNYFLLSLTGQINDDSHRILILGVRAFFSFFFSFEEVRIRAYLAVPFKLDHSSSWAKCKAHNSSTAGPCRLLLLHYDKTLHMRRTEGPVLLACYLFVLPAGLVGDYR